MANELNDDIKFALNLIATEEDGQSEQNMMDDTQQKNGLILIQQRDFTISNQFTMSGEDELGDPVSMPITGEGFLDTFVIRTNNENFKVKTEIDDYNITDDEFNTLKNITTELSHIGAYTDNGTHVVAVSDYSFNERINIVISALPSFEIDVNLARVEIFMGRDVDNENGLDPEKAELLERT